MPSIEKQIGVLTNLESIHEWIWYGKPLSEIKEPDSHPVRSWPSFRSWSEVDLLILSAAAHECLTSESEYIRECKRWFLNLSLEDTIQFVLKDILSSESYIWQGKPNSLNLTEEMVYNAFRDMSMHLYIENDQHFTNEQNRQFAKRNYSCMLLADKLILRSDDNIALTSPNLYIRECKKWFIDHRHDILSIPIYYHKYHTPNSG